MCKFFFKEFLRIHNFYSHSFVPDDLNIDYKIRDGYGLYYNVTAFSPFPGKLLMNFFVRKFNAVKFKSSTDVLKEHNLDFCKTLEHLKVTNIGDEYVETQPLLQETFLQSCPLTKGFYYLQNTTLTQNLLPWLTDNGRYLIQFELIQIVSDTIKLLNLRFMVIIDSKDEKE